MNAADLLATIREALRRAVDAVNTDHFYACRDGDEILRMSFEFTDRRYRAALDHLASLPDDVVPVWMRSGDWLILAQSTRGHIKHLADAYGVDYPLVRGMPDEIERQVSGRTERDDAHE